jgi:hypothetical protein
MAILSLSKQPMRFVRVLAVVLLPVTILAAVHAWRPPQDSLRPAEPAHAPIADESLAAINGDLSPSFEVVGQPEFTMPVAIAGNDSWLVVLDPVGRIKTRAIRLDRAGRAGAMVPIGLPIVPNDVTTSATGDYFLLKNSDDNFAMKVVLNSQVEPVVTRESAPPGAMTILGTDKATRVGAGMMSDALLVRYSVTDPTQIDRVGHALFPEIAAPKLSSYLNRNSIAANPSDGRIVQAFLLSSRLHLYSPNGYVLRRSVAGPIDVRLSYASAYEPAVRSDRFVSEDQTRLCFLSVAASSDYIYALFDGRARGPFRRHAAFGTQLMMFDWDGEYLGCWRLSVPVHAIAIAGATPRVWGISDGPEARLVAYDLPHPPSH